MGKRNSVDRRVDIAVVSADIRGVFNFFKDKAQAAAKPSNSAAAEPSNSTVAKPAVSNLRSLNQG